MTPPADRPGRPVVLHVISGLDRGGAELMLARLVRGSHAFRHVVVSLTGDGTLGAGLRGDGIEVVALDFRSARGAVAGFARLVRLIRALRPAVVQTWLYHADLVGLIAARLAGCRRVAWNLRCSDMDRKRYGRLVALLARLSPLPAVVLANSEAGKSWHHAQGYRPRRWQVIANGIDTARFRPDPDARRQWRAQLGLAEDSVVVGMVARVDAMKDHATFLAAAERLKAESPGIVFLAAGRGTETLPEGAVLRLGEVEDTAGLYAALDVAVLMSRFGEGFPNVVAEAMACGVPAVVSASGDAARIVGDAGMVVPIGDEAGLRQAVLALAASAELRQSLGARGRERILAHHDHAAAIQAYEEHWRRVAAI